MREHASTAKALVWGGMVLAAVVARIAYSAAPAAASDRMVLCESFTGTWVRSCLESGEALNQMLNEYGEGGTIAPGSLTMVQYHWADPYAFPWGHDIRKAFYAVPSFPDVFFDGLIEVLGGGEPMYPAYNPVYLDRVGRFTDVTLEVGGEADGQDFSASVRIAIESGGTGKTLRLQIVQVLDFYPPEGGYHRNCFMQHLLEQDVTLNPGESQTVQSGLFTFDPASWNNQGNIKLIAWAQDVRAVWPAVVHQAAVMPWPLAPLLITGDMDGSGVVDAGDVGPFVMALIDRQQYLLDHPTIDPADVDTLGDTNEDGLFNGLDIQSFVTLVL